MENNNTKNLLMIILVILAVTGCLLLSCCAGTLFVIARTDTKEYVNSFLESEEMQEFIEPYDNAEISPIDETIPEEVPETAPVSESADADVSVSSVLTESQQKIINASEKFRELEPEGEVNLVYKSEDELREYLTDEFFAESTDQDFIDEMDLYRVLAFVPDDFDLKQFYLDLYTEQIAGFYDEETNDMVLVSDISETENDLTLAHEYTHFMQYNNSIFSDVLKYDDDYCEDHSEECLIFDAIAEGDASLVEALLEQEAGLISYSEDEEEAESSVFDNAPVYFQDNLLFPYLYGFDFVWYHYMKGGFDAVNDLYLNPPASIEQVMHPEKYGTDDPVDINMYPFRDILEKNSEIIQEAVFNENDIYELLSAPYREDWAVDEDQAVLATEGWGGGEYIFARSEDQPIFFSKVVWDSAKDAKDAEKAFTVYNNQRFGEKDGNQWKGSDGFNSWLFRQDDITFWMVFPDSFDAESIVNRLSGGSSL